MRFQRNAIYCIVLIFSLLQFAVVHANQTIPANSIRLKHFSMSNGLPGETVRVVYQDNEGFIWMGIESFGLCRFNGIQFDIFGHLPADSSSLSSDFVEAVAEDKKGNLWIGTDFGLNKFDKNLLAISQGNEFVRYLHHESEPASISGNMIYALLRDHQGKMWIGTSGGLNILKDDLCTFEKYKLNPTVSPEVFSIYG
jgi:ligand-binding sensor domain-containing protein